MHPQLKEFVESLHQQACDKREPTQSDLIEIANEIRRICEAYPIDESKYPRAGATQELMYPIAVSESGGPSLYLVSEAAGVTSAPHEHQTWAVIVGLGGSETNTVYRRAPGEGRSVHKVAEVVVRAGEVFCLLASDVHSTLVGTLQSSYHLHLYGRPLLLLPSFASRCYAFNAVA